GSFSGEPKKALLLKITRAGYYYKIIRFPQGGRQISKLLIGPYKQKEQALQVLPSVKENIQQDAFIAEIR
ncbi:MAG: SPOR domain-containing protein, partial [Sulfurovum sp.]